MSFWWDQPPLGLTCESVHREGKPLEVAESSERGRDVSWTKAVWKAGRQRGARVGRESKSHAGMRFHEEANR